jgi:ACT domain-containing protein
MNEAMQQFNLEISDSKKYKSLIFPTDEGLSVAIKL